MEQPETIRRAAPADARGIARVHVESWRATYAGIVAADVLDGLSVERRAEYWAGALDKAASPGVHYVALDASGHIVGFASAGPERDATPGFTSELYAIYLLAATQGRGVGKRLVRALASDLLDDGHATMLVWVLAENPARHFYAALGGRRVAAKTLRLGPDELEEVAYGWDNLHTLVDSI